MSWKSINIPSGSRLFKNHKFTFMHAGNTYMIDIDEFMNGVCTGHAEHSTDSSSVIPAVNGKSIEECLQAVVDKIQARTP